MTSNSSISTITSLSMAALLAPTLANAIDVGGVEVGIQPRFETGMMYDNLDVNPVSISNPRSNHAQQSFSIKDNLFFFGGGATLFVERFFADFSALRAINGNSESKFGFSDFNQSSDSSGSSFNSADSSFNANFDRNEYTISLGYGITKQLAVFTGYKWVKSNIDASGPGYVNTVGSHNIEATSYSKNSYEFKYNGPFLGLNYGLEIKQGWLEGVLSFNSAVAYLNGELNRQSGETYVTINKIDGVSVG